MEVKCFEFNFLPVNTYVISIQQSSRTLYYLGTLHGKLVYLQPVVIAPLLAFMLDAVLTYGHTVESKPADHGFGLPGAYAHGFHTGYALQGLHKAHRRLLRCSEPAAQPPQA